MHIYIFLLKLSLREVHFHILVSHVQLFPLKNDIYTRGLCQPYPFGEITMNHAEYSQYDALSLAELVRKKEVTAKELAQLANGGIEFVNPQINAVIEVFEDRLDVDDASLPEGPFRGVPFLRKDLGATESGRRQEMGSRLTVGFVPEGDSFYGHRSKRQG